MQFYGVWNEPNLGTLPDSPVQQEGKAGLALHLRPAVPGGLRRDQGRQSGCARRDRRDLSAGPRRPVGRSRQPGDAGAADVRAAAGDGSAEGPVRRLVAPPVLHARYGAEAAHALPEREPADAAVVRGTSEQVVQAQVDADLDHRVRLSDEAGRAEGRGAGAAGGVPADGGRDGPGDAVREDVHLVHLPGRSVEHLAERRPVPRTGERSRRRTSSPVSPGWSTDGTGS